MLVPEASSLAFGCSRAPASFLSTSIPLMHALPQLLSHLVVLSVHQRNHSVAHIAEHTWKERLFLCR